MASVSVIIPTYNHRDFVTAAIESVFAQSFSDYEIIVVDDGSSDDTAQLLQPLADLNKIRLIRQSNAGQAAARNTGVTASTGEFIAFLDDDDVWPNDKLAWQVEALQRNGRAVAIGGSVELINALGDHVCEVPMKARTVSFESLFEGPPFWSPGQTLIRAKTLRAANLLDKTVPGADDFDLWLKLSTLGLVLTDPRPSLRYRLHAGNASRNLEGMHSSCLKVINRYLRNVNMPERRRLRRSANRWMYDYLGRRSLSQLRRDLLSFKIARLGGSFLLWARFIRSAVADRYIFSALTRDVFYLGRRRSNIELLLDGESLSN